MCQPAAARPPEALYRLLATPVSAVADPQGTPAMSVIRQAVVSVVRSPMNPKQWRLELACGHEVWWTARGRRPRDMECTVCVCTPNPEDREERT